MIDWTSVKLMGISSVLAVISWNPALILSIIGFTTTIIYNVIRIYKELKKK